MVTVHDVAARSGVSIATVSRSLREPHRVSEATRERVLTAVRELGYQPNRAARSLRRGRTGVIALVVPDIENPYFSSLTKGAQASARDNGYGLVVIDTTERAEVEADEIVAVRSQVDGMILASPRLSDEALTAVVELTPSVLVNRRLDVSVPTVTVDEAIGSRAAVGHLRELGHARVAYVGGPGASWSQRRRSRGVREAVAAIDGLELVEYAAASPDAAGGRAIAEEVIASTPTAVIAYNDLVAVGLLARWTDLGVVVPRDVSLVGFDNANVTELTTPRITSVGADLRAIGETAVRLVIERIENQGAAAQRTDVELRPRMEVRSSTSAPRS